MFKFIYKLILETITMTNNNGKLYLLKKKIENDYRLVFVLEYTYCDKYQTKCDFS